MSSHSGEALMNSSIQLNLLFQWKRTVPSSGGGSPSEGTGFTLPDETQMFSLKQLSCKTMMIALRTHLHKPFSASRSITGFSPKRLIKTRKKI